MAVRNHYIRDNHVLEDSIKKGLNVDNIAPNYDNLVEDTTSYFSTGNGKFIVIGIIIVCIILTIIIMIALLKKNKKKQYTINTQREKEMEQIYQDSKKRGSVDNEKENT